MVFMENGLCHYGDIVRAVVEPCSIWRCIIFLMIPRIESIYRLEDLDFTDIPRRDMIQDSEFNLGFQERRI
jgi:hypothetical protein